MIILSLILMMKCTLNYILNSYIFLVKQNIEKLGDPSLITEWTHNMDKAAFLEQSEKEVFLQPSRKKDINR